MNKKRIIKLGHSPDADDAFMFFALANDKIDTGDFQFEHILRDIQTLNDWAHDGRLEVTAVSVHAYPFLQHRYAILSSGASMGATELLQYVPDDNQPMPQLPDSKPTGVHGPLLVARQPIPTNELLQLTIAVPGTLTSAFLALKLALGDFQFRVMPFDQILPAVEQGQVPAGLIIHEGQLTFGQHGLHKILDLGQWWFDRKKLPLPLGCNLIRRDLGSDAMHQISRILRASIEYSLAHRDDALRYALQFGRDVTTQQADHFVGMYVNPWTINYGPLGRRAIAEFLADAHRANLTPAVENLEFI